eukprot:11236831-Ditylum_brightwellii.AAC.2
MQQITTSGASTEAVEADSKDNIDVPVVLAQSFESLSVSEKSGNTEGVSGDSDSAGDVSDDSAIHGDVPDDLAIVGDVPDGSASAEKNFQSCSPAT